ncbi:MAG: D-sedoheptulose 7-phosphate isomerase [Methylococcales bacterium]
MASLNPDIIKSQIQASIITKQRLLEDTSSVERIRQVVEVIVACYRKGGKVMLAGNGGSAADAQHIAAELVNKLCFNRPALASIALTTDTSVLTAVANDSSVDYIFSRQIEAISKVGDVFIGISTSGNSPNVVEALKKARELNVVTIGFCGALIGKMDEYCDFCVKVPSTDTPRIQECHILLGHIVCSLVEAILFDDIR